MDATVIKLDASLCPSIDPYIIEALSASYKVLSFSFHCKFCHSPRSFLLSCLSIFIMTIVFYCCETMYCGNVCQKAAWQGSALLFPFFVIYRISLTSGIKCYRRNLNQNHVRKCTYTHFSPQRNEREGSTGWL